MIYLGIDPGKKGGIAIIPERGEPTTLPYSDTDLIIACKSAGEI